MKYYGKIGETCETIDESSNPVCPEGYIEMDGPRPEGDYVAGVNGSWVLREKTAEEVRAERNAKIAETDYLIMPDYPISGAKLEEVKAYRKALRDITTQTGFPESIEWPKMPVL